MHAEGCTEACLVLHAGGSRVTLGRFRMAFIGLLAVACALEMWAANVVLNLAGRSCFTCAQIFVASITGRAHQHRMWRLTVAELLRLAASTLRAEACAFVCVCDSLASAQLQSLLNRQHVAMI